MKTIIVWSIVMLHSATGLMPQALSFNTEKPGRETQLRINHSLVSGYQAANGMAGVELKKIKAGYNLIATDTRNGRELYMFAKRSDGQLSISGFAVRNCTARWINMHSENSSEADRASGCPQGRDRSIICYSHPTYPVEVCQMGYTPTHLTLRLPTTGF